MSESNNLHSFTCICDGEYLLFFRFGDMKFLCLSLTSSQANHACSIMRVRLNAVLYCSFVNCPGVFMQNLPAGYPKFIATQGPLNQTEGDFWSLILQDKVEV